MKKIFSIALVIILAVSLVACGVKKNNDTIDDNEILSEQTSKIDDSAEASSNGIEWKQFLRDYEEWVDKYIEITKKYKNNPTDMSILSDYTNMMTELTEWYDKIDEVQSDLESASPGELAEYSSELARIAGKLSKVAY